MMGPPSKKPDRYNTAKFAEEAEEVGRHVAVREAVDASFAVRISQCLLISLRIAIERDGRQCGGTNAYLIGYLTVRPASQSLNLRAILAPIGLSLYEA